MAVLQGTVASPDGLIRPLRSDRYDVRICGQRALQPARYACRGTRSVWTTEPGCSVTPRPTVQSVLPLMLETRVVLTARTPTPSRARQPPRPAVRWLGCRLSSPILPVRRSQPRRCYRREGREWRPALQPSPGTELHHHVLTKTPAGARGRTPRARRRPRDARWPVSAVQFLDRQQDLTLHRIAGLNQAEHRASALGSRLTHRAGVLVGSPLHVPPALTNRMVSVQD